MIRKTILALLLLCASLAARGEGECLYATTADGTVLTIVLEDGMWGDVWCPSYGDERPYHLCIFTGTASDIDNGQPVFDNPEQLKLDLPFAELRSLSVYDPAGIDSPTTDMELRIDIANSIITLTGLSEAVDVAVHDLGGSELMRQTVSEDTSIDLSRCRHGILIVTAGKETFKILVP